MSVKRFVVFGVLLLFLPGSLFASSSPKTHRTPYRLEVSSRIELDRLSARGLDIAAVHGQTVTLYLSEAERSNLEHQDYVLFPVPVTPRPVAEPGKGLGLSYPASAEALETELNQLAAAYPDICRLESAGPSVEGRDLLWVRLSDNATMREAEPSVCLIGSMHGDEPLGLVLCLAMIRELVAGYGQDSRITDLLNTTDIRIMPLLNPDGYNAQSRYNSNGMDLNRDFPDARPLVPDTAEDTSGRQPETLAVMDWLLDQRPSLSANLHSGSLVVNFPFDYTYIHSPDDTLFQVLSLIYAQNNPPMGASSEFENGIVRGADWYVATGTLQDWAYLATGELHVTVETSETKTPATSALDGLWTDNREALLAYVEAVHTGIGGRILDAGSGDPVPAFIRIQDNEHLMFSDPMTGYFQRPLEQGSYTLTVGAPGYAPQTLSGITVDDGGTTTLSIDLLPDPENRDVMPGNWPDKGDDPDPTLPPDDGGSGGGCFIRAMTG